MREGDYYQHRKGGVYRVQALARLEADGSLVVMYEHQTYQSPLQRVCGDGQMWVRPQAEFKDGRFTLISPYDARLITSGEMTEPSNYAPEGDEFRCPTCWRSNKTDLGDMFLSGIEASCGHCGATWLWFGKEE